MHPVLETLALQHRDAESMLSDLEAAATRVRRGGARHPDVMAELGRLRGEIHGEVLGHFRDEELALFPVLGRHVDSSSGPIAMLMEEHAQFRQLELEFEQALAALESGDATGWDDKLCDAVDAIRKLLPPHIEKEDEVLFPMAESMLDDAEWSQVEALIRQASKAVARPTA